MAGQTKVSIYRQQFLLNGRPTYEGRHYGGMRIEGLLLNSRMVQATFDDLNEATRAMWDYPDRAWNPDVNTEEFVRAMPEWRRHGLLGITLNLQGGNPQGYGKNQPWHNSAFRADGSLRPAYLERMTKVLEAADELGMVVILGYMYFGQDERLNDDAAVLAAVDGATDWLLDNEYTNVLVEIGNEVDHPRWEQPLVQAPRCANLIRRVQERSQGRLDTPAGRLLVSTSLCGGRVPADDLVEACDFILLHGNGVASPDGIREMVDATRRSGEYRDQPILFNEDDHFDFDAPDNHMLAAIGRYAGWGYFDWRQNGEGYEAGYQSVPVDWTISSPRKKAFFDLLAEVTDG